MLNELLKAKPVKNWYGEGHNTKDIAALSGHAEKIQWLIFVQKLSLLLLIIKDPLYKEQANIYACLYDLYD